MKDEEMAEQFADNISGLDLTCSLLSSKDKRHAYRLGRYDGFLAGLKAGRPQWHKVADGDLPKDEDYKCCISSNGVYYVARYEELFVSWTNQENKEVCCPYAWQEIIPPKESE